MPSSAASRRAARARRSGVGLQIRTALRSRTRATQRAWARAWVPEPSTPSSALSGVASASKATALAAAVRRVVTAVPSMTAASCPVAGSNALITAWIVGSPAAALPGLTLPTLATAPVSADSRARYANTTLSSNPLGCMIFPGSSAVPSPSAVKASRWERIAASVSSRSVTCSRERWRTSSVIPLPFPCPHRCHHGPGVRVTPVVVTRSSARPPAAARRWGRWRRAGRLRAARVDVVDQTRWPTTASRWGRSWSSRSRLVRR